MDLNEILSKKNQITALRNELRSEMAAQNGSDDELLVDVNVVQLVSFSIDQIEYGVAILAVHDIIMMPELTRLPNTPDFIKGVINLRGNVIPVVDVRRRFGFHISEIKESSRIIVIEISEKLIGLMVDAVNQVVRIPESNISPPSEMIDGVSETFIEGIGRMKDRLIIMLRLSTDIFLEKKIEDLDQIVV